MKKLVLTSIIMFSVCGIISAQSVNDINARKAAAKEKAAGNTPAPVIQSAAYSPSDQAEAAAKAENSPEYKQKMMHAAKQNAANPDAATDAQKAAVVGVDGVAVHPDILKKQEMLKAENAKKAAEKKKSDN